MGAAFAAYFCMYAFRKPVTATEFAGESFGATGVELKTAFLIGQVVGYAISKYVGIVVCSALRPEHRARTLVAFVLVAQASLVAFGALPGGWRVAAMVVNGLPLGMVWGLVVRYLEGRRTSDLLLAGLSASFVVSSGAVKDVGLWLMTAHGVPEPWMPAAIGALFLVPFVVSVLLLDRAPPPDEHDEAERVPRKPMDAAERRRFARRFGPGLVPLLGAYLLLTAYRDFRDNYGLEIFRELGFLDVPGLFTRSELPAAFGVLVALALLTRVRDNRNALTWMYGMMVGGSGLVLASTWLFRTGAVGGLGWMVLTGVGIYLGYVPVGAMLFDRLTAAGGAAGTAIFGIYIADAVGYSGSVGVQLYRDLWAGGETRLEFFVGLSHVTAMAGLVLLSVSLFLVSRSLGGARGAPAVMGPPASEVGGA